MTARFALLARALVVLTTFSVLISALGAAAPPSNAQAPAGTTDLMLLLDASGSISAEDWLLQKDGYAAALADRVAFPLDGTIAVGVLQWSASVTLEVPLTVLDSEETLAELTAAILAIEQVPGGTQPGDAVRAGTEELLANGREGPEWNLCMSTDGAPNGGESIGSAVPFARESGVDRYSVIAIEDPEEGFDQSAAIFEYGPYTIGTGGVTVARSTAEFASLIIGTCLNPQLTLVGIEVNQAIQDWTNSVALIEGKTTVVRAFVETPGDELVRATGRLTGTRDGVPLPGSPLTAASPGGSVLAGSDVAARRGDIDASLNFALPLSWRSGTVTLRLEVPGGSACSEVSPPAGDCAALVTFLPADVLEVEMVGVRYRTGDDGPDTAPTQQNLVEQVRRIGRVLPFGGVAATYSTLENTYDEAPQLEDVNGDLALQRLLDGCIGLQRPLPQVCNRLYYGVLLGDADGGLANGLPGTEASGYTGGTEGLRATGYARNRAPHEVAHLLGRPHAVSSAFGEGVGACGEVAAATAAEHPYFAEIDGVDRALIGLLESRDTEIWGLDPRYIRGVPELAVVDPRTTFALMSYCQPLAEGQGRWVDQLTYFQLRGAIAGGIPGADVGATVSGDVRVIRGLIDLTANTVAFEPFPGYPTTLPLPQPAAGDYALELVDGAGQVIETIPFAPTIMEADEPPGGGGGPPDRALFVIPVADRPELRRVVIRNAGVEIGAVDASAAAPTVSVVAPAEGDALTGETVSFAWSGQDADGDALTYSVQYSADDGTTWDTLAVDLAATDLTLDRSALAGSPTARLRVLASDGVNTGSAVSGRFSVADSGSLLTVDSPTSGEVYSGVQQILLAAGAWDREDGDLTGDAIDWSSDLDGVLGSGEELAVVAGDLTEGPHVVTVTATDSAGNVATATVTIEVQRVAAPPPVADDVTPPVLTVPAPIVVDATSPSGATVSYTVTVTDAADPSPVVACEPASGSVFPIGTSVVTCVATDSSGNSVPGSFEVRVRGAAQQLDNLEGVILGFDLDPRLERQLAGTVRLAAALEERERTDGACRVLRLFQSRVQALTGDGLTAEQADALRTSAARIRAVLGCDPS